MLTMVRPKTRRLATCAAGVLLTLAALARGAPPPARQPTLAEAYQVLASRRFVDLTHAFGPDIPVWSGFGQATFSAAADPRTYRPYSLEQDGFRATFYSLVGQYGTHVDPPAHFHPRGATLDQIPLQQMILPLIVLDLTPLLGRDPAHALTVADIEAWERQHGRVPQGAFAALRTDMWKDFTANPARFQRSPFPAWSLAAVRFLVERREVTAIGHESLDTDTTQKMESETWLLGQGRWQLEAMAHLDEVPPTGALIVVAWPKVKNGLGFPARAFAILP